MLAKLEEMYDRTETSVIYGIQKGKDLPDADYIRVLKDILQIPQQDVAVMYHGTIKPYLQRIEQEEGLVSLVMDKS